MTVFRISEGPGTADPDNPEEYGELAFFRQNSVNEHYFPPYDIVSLVLSESEIDQTLMLLTAAETVAGAFGTSVTIQSNAHNVGYLDVEAGDEDGFRVGFSELELQVTQRVGTVRWITVNEYDDSSISTDWLNRDHLLAMRQGHIPTT